MQSDQGGPEVAPEQRDPARPWRYLVGVGASAGGLEALEAFFDSIPEGTGCAYVVIQHLSPDFKSLMDQLLARHSPLRIQRAESGMLVEPECIYLITPRTDMRIEDGRLQLTDVTNATERHLPIDVFFESIAHQAGEDGIAVILSGSGSDGSRGARTLKDFGGAVLVQSPATAKFDAMPKAAIAAGAADYVGSPEDLGRSVVRVAAGHALLETTRKSPGDVPGDPIGRLLEAIKHEVGPDLSRYKMATIERRVGRRVRLLQFSSLEAYQEFALKDFDELVQLSRDLLIGVTDFFRDSEAFESLEAEIPGVFERAPDDGVRVWVAGCSTGEEAISIAILLDEHRRRIDSRLDFKVFATDLRSAALDRAGRGEYPETIADRIPVDRLSRYFDKTTTGYRLRTQLRERIVYAEHDLLSNPPFTRMQIVSCRNLLIYLEPEAQREIVRKLHFALVRDGLLFLGSSESVVDLADEFGEIDSTGRLYNKLRDSRLSGLSETTANLRDRRRLATRRSEQSLDLDAVCGALFGEYAPVCFVLDPSFRILYSHGDPSELLRIPAGPMDGDILKMVTPEFRAAISVGSHRAHAESQSVVESDVLVKLDDEASRAEVRIVPVKSNRRGGTDLTLVLVGPLTLGGHPENGSGADRKDAEFERVRSELQVTKESLSTTVEELETTNEELQSTNEELLASNEELQSTNEELHSVNEELYTVNAEHQSKIDEVTRAHSEMEALMASTGVGTIFLDELLCIRKFTPEAAALVYLLDSDIGRPITHLAHLFRDFDLSKSCLEVIQQGELVEHSVLDSAGRSQLVRIVPYREQGTIEGVVVSLIAVDQILDRAEAVLESRFQKAYERLGVHVIAFDGELSQVVFMSQGLSALLGLPADALRTDPQALLQSVHSSDEPRVRSAFEALPHSGELRETFRVLDGDGSVRWIQLQITAVHGSEEEGVVQYLGRASDETPSRALWENFVFHRNSADLSQVLEISDRFEELYGVTREEILADRNRFLDPVDERDHAQLIRALQDAPEKGEFDLRYTIHSPDGKSRKMRARGWPEIDPATGERVSWYGIAFEES